MRPLQGYICLWLDYVNLQFRAAIMILIYDKALKCSIDAAPPTGTIMNLLTTDVNAICTMLPQVMLFFYLPIQLIGTVSSSTCL